MLRITHRRDASSGDKTIRSPNIINLIHHTNTLGTNLHLQKRILSQILKNFRRSRNPRIPLPPSKDSDVRPCELCTYSIKGKFFPVHAMRVYRADNVATLLIFYLGTRWMWAINITPRPLHPRGRTPVSDEQEVGWVPEPVWAFQRKISCPYRGSNPRTVHPVAQSLHWLIYSGSWDTPYSLQVRFRRVCKAAAKGNYHLRRHLASLPSVFPHVTTQIPFWRILLKI